MTVRAYDWDGIHRATGNGDDAAYADRLTATVTDNPGLVTDVPVPGLAELAARVAELEDDMSNIDPDVDARLQAAAAALAGDTVVDPPPAGGGGGGWLRPTGGDDTQLLLDEVERLKTVGRAGVLRLEGQFNMTETLKIGNFHVDADTAELISTADVAIQVGEPGEVVSRKRLALPWVIGNGEGSSGVRMVAAKANTVTVDAYRFDKALHLNAEGQGVAWNTYTLRSIRGRIPIALEPGEGGWNNQNTFIGGQLFPDFVEGGPRGPSILIEGYSNNNAFFNPSPEGNDQEWMIDCNGPWNYFAIPRFEGKPAKVRFRGHAEGNIIVGGYDLTKLVIDESELAPALQGTNLLVNPYAGVI